MQVARGLLTLHEAALQLGVDESTLRRWIARGRFPAYRTPGGRFRIAEDDLQLALEPAHRPATGGSAAGETAPGEDRQ